MSAHSQDELQDRLWKEIHKARYGMLGLVGRTPAHHFQPMTAFCEPDNGQICSSPGPTPISPRRRSRAATPCSWSRPRTRVSRPASAGV